MREESVTVVVPFRSGLRYRIQVVIVDEGEYRVLVDKQIGFRPQVLGRDEERSIIALPLSDQGDRVTVTLVSRRPDTSALGDDDTPGRREVVRPVIQFIADERKS